MNFIDSIQIQSWWQVPSIGHFCSLFSSLFDLPDFDIEDLEEALLTDSADTANESASKLLPELIVALLKGCESQKRIADFIQTSNYQMFLRRLFRKKCQEHTIENPFDSDTDFQSLPLRTKVLILNYLCDFRLDAPDAQEILPTLEADSLRVEPLGYDNNKSVYWYFFGTRLYREDYINKKPTKSNPSPSVWQVVCFSEEDWNKLTLKFKHSKNQKESALHHVLQNEFLPKIPALFQQKEQERRRRVLQRRTESRLRALNDQRKQKPTLAINDELLLCLNDENDDAQSRKSDGNRSINSNGQWTAKYKYLKEKEEQLQARKQYREKIQRDRSLRAARRQDRCCSVASNSTIASSSRCCEFTSDLSLQPETTDNGGGKFSSLLKSVISEKESQKNLNNLINVCVNSISDNKVDRDTLEQKLGKMKKTVNSASKKVKVHKRKVAKKVAAVTAKSATKVPPTTITKLPGRQTNNSLSSITAGQILIETTNTVPSSTNLATPTTSASKNVETTPTSSPAASPRKKKNKAAEVFSSTTLTSTLSFTETDEVLQIGMHKVLESVKNHDDAWPFMDPVEEDIAPRYYTIIRRPMDLLKMEEKLDNGEYLSFHEFRNDFKLIVNNCRLYNGQANEYTDMVNNLQIAFEKATKKYFDQNSSDEEGYLEYPELKSNVFKEKIKSKSELLLKEKNANSNTDDEEGKSEEEEDDCVEALKITKKSNKKSKIRAKNLEKKKPQSLIKNQKFIDTKQKAKLVEVTRGTKRKRKEKDKDKNKKKKIKLDSSLSHDEDEADNDYDRDEMICQSPVHNSTSYHESSSESEVFEDSDLEDDKKKPPNKTIKKSRASLFESPLVEDTKKHKEKSKKISPPVSTAVKRGLKLKDDGTTKDKEKNLPSKQKKVEKPKTNDKSRKNQITKDKHKSSKPNKRKRKCKESDSQASSDEDDHEDDEKSLLQSTDDEKDEATELLLGNLPQEFSSDDNAIDSPIISVGDDSGTRAEKTTTASKKTTKTANLSDTKIKTKKSKALPEKMNDPMTKHKRKYNKKLKPDEHRPRSKSPEKNKPSASGSNKKPKNMRNVLLSSPVPHKTKIKDVENDDLHSNSSLSRSSSPFPSFYSNSSHSDDELNELILGGNTKKTPKKQKPASRPVTPEFRDKFDLIKQRRAGRTTNTTPPANDDRWDQIVKEAEKIKESYARSKAKAEATANALSTEGKIVEKNHKLKETIEKLKMKSEKNKERQGLIDEIFGVKPSKHIHDEKTIVEKLRETYGENKTSATCSSLAVNNLKPGKSEYDFVDDTIDTKEKVTSTTAVSKKTKTSASKIKSPKENIKQNNKKESCAPSSSQVSKLKKDKKTTNQHQVLSATTSTTLVPAVTGKKSMNTIIGGLPPPPPPPPVAKVQKANMEALELETEQTLKDINKWLENTPRFSEFSSASNSPSRYIIDDLDGTAPQTPAIVTKSDSTEFRKPNNSTPTPSSGNMDSSSNLLKEINTNSGRQVPGCSQNSSGVNMTVPQNVSTSGTAHKKDQTSKEAKRRNLKDKLANLPRKKEHQRTIERLQPGKTKGNLITSIQNLNKPDDLFPLGGNPGKLKEVKNSLIVKTSETGPKLSLGSVLDTEGFGLIQQHNFNDDDVTETRDKILTEIKPDIKDKHFVAEKEKLIKSPERNAFIEQRSPAELEPNEEKPTSNKMSTNPLTVDIETETAKSSQDKKEIEETGKTAATPNLSAWFKAFGAPKKTTKKTDEDEKDEKKQEDEKKSSELAISASTKSPSYPVVPRQRKASTGSEVSEQSSFSQDLDSPRIGIDERLSGSTYPAPYPSPMGASPIMAASPHTIDEPKSSYSLNGAIKVGFYQDTTTKSSPEKSCSPRELPPSPYPQYSQHLYSTSSATSSLYGNYNYAQQQATMSSSPRTYSNQPQEQLSPYHQQPNSPYQQPSTPQYSQQQIASPHSPFQPQAQPAYQQPNNIGSNKNNNNNQYSQPLSTGSNPGQQNPSQNMLPSPNSPFSPSNNSSPYSQHDPNSPYSQHGQLSPFQPIMSPKSQAPVSASSSNNNGGNGNKGPAPNNQQQQPITPLPLTQQPPQIPNDWAVQAQIPAVPTVPPSQQSSTILSKQSNNVNIAQEPPTANSLHYKVPNQQNLQMNQPIQSQLNSQPTLGLDNSSMIQNVTPQTSANHQQQINMQPAHSHQNIPSYMHHPNNYSTENPYDLNNKKKPDQQVRNTEMINLGYSDSSSDNLQHNQSKVPESGQNVPTLNTTVTGKTKQQQEEDYQLFNRILAYGKGTAPMNFEKPLDISKNKPMDVFNRTNMPFGRNFPDNPNLHLHQMNRNAPAEIVTSSSPGDSILDVLQKSTASELGRNLIRSLDQNLASNKSQTSISMCDETTAAANATQPKTVPSNLNNMQNKQYASQQHMFNMPTSSTTGMLDPSLRNFPGLGMIRDYHQSPTDDRLLGLQPQPGPAAGYYEKSNLFGKNLPSATAALQQMFTSTMTTMAYNSVREQQHQQVQQQQQQQQQKHSATTGLYGDNSGYHHQSSRMQSIMQQQSQIQHQPQQQHQQQQQNLQTQQQTLMTASTKKPRKKKGSSTPSGQAQHSQQTVDISAGILPHQQQQLQQQQQQHQMSHQQQQQGFQSYLKTPNAASNSGGSVSATDSGAISLKTTSVVPGSAFNFGPTPPLGLGSGLYGENSGGYLDDFRNTPNPYYLPPPTTTHRGTPDINTDKQTNQTSSVPPVAPPTAPTSPYHSFLTQHSRQAAYFMGQQLDPLQQQYIQRQEEFRTQMMLNQGLHGTYPQSGYHPLGRGWL